MASTGRTSDDAQQRSDRQLTPQLESGLELFPRPTAHADFAPAATLAAPYEQRAASLVKIVFSQFQRLVNAEPGSPEDHDERAHPPAVRTSPAARMTATISSTLGGSVG
jgi:hypothetical protein